MAKIIEKLASTVINPLSSDTQISVEKRVFSQGQSQVDCRVPETDSHVSTHGTQVRQALPLYSQSPQYGIQFGDHLKNTMKEPTQELDHATLASRSRVCPTAIVGPSRIGEETVVNDKTIRFPINPSKHADLRCTDEERSDTNEDLRRKSYGRRIKGDCKFSG